MPGPLDKLTQSIVPQSWIQPAQDYLTEPHLDQSPAMAKLKGFGAGALQGLRDLATPANIATAMVPPMGGAVRGVAAAARPVRALEAAFPAVREAVPAAFGEGAWAGGQVHGKNWAAELNAAKDLLAKMSVR